MTAHSYRFRNLAAVLLYGVSAAVAAGSSCDGLFYSGMESPRYAPVQPSGGCGGAYPGSVDRVVTVGGLGAQGYSLFIPSSYRPELSHPLLIAWHGAAGPGQAANAAQQLLDLWSTVAQENGFIVAVQVATGAQGGWIPSHAEATFDAILLDTANAYNIDLARRFAWGFSAGGHVLHAVALERSLVLAGYGAQAGVLAAYAGTSAPQQALRRIPVMIRVGSSDPLMPYAQSDVQVFQLAGWTSNSDLFYQVFSGGHIFTTTDLGQFWTQLGQLTAP